jgi:hypothetical protein
MQKELKYNLKCPESDRQLTELYFVCNTIKEGLHKKEYEVYESLLNKLHQITAMQVNIFNREIHDFRSNDSDNENNYDENIRNITNEEFAEDSVSEYETDSEDEDYKKTKSLIEFHDDKCYQILLDLKNYSLFEFE